MLDASGFIEAAIEFWAYESPGQHIGADHVLSRPHLLKDIHSAIVPLPDGRLCEAQAAGQGPPRASSASVPARPGGGPANP